MPKSNCNQWLMDMPRLPDIRLTEDTISQFKNIKFTLVSRFQLKDKYLKQYLKACSVLKYTG